MLDGRPFHPAENRGDGDGDIGEHKQREREHIQNLLARRGVDVVPLGQRGDQADDQQESVYHRDIAQQRDDRHQHLVPVARDKNRMDKARHVADYAQQRNENGGKNRHQQVKAAERQLEKRPLDQLQPVFAEHLIEALRPAHPLPPRLAEGDGLLVVEHSGGAIADFLALNDRIDRKLHILGQQMVLPPAVLLHQLSGEQEARARDGAGGVQLQPRVVQILRLAQKPERIAGRDPVRTVVLGVAVAGNGLESQPKGLVHLRDILAVDEVVGVKDDERVAVVVRRQDFFEHIVQRVALADKVAVLPFKHGRARRPRNLGGVVGAVVGADVDADELSRIGLRVDALDKLADHRRLVAGGDDHRNLVHHRVAVDKPLAEAAFEQEHIDHIENLVGIADGENNPQSGFNGVYYVHSMFSVNFYRSCKPRKSFSGFVYYTPFFG